MVWSGGRLLVISHNSHKQACSSTHLQSKLLDRLVTSQVNPPNSQETSDPDVIRSRRPQIEQQLQHPSQSSAPRFSPQPPAQTHLQVRPNLSLPLHDPRQHLATLRNNRIEQTVDRSFCVLVAWCRWQGFDEVHDGCEMRKGESRKSVVSFGRRLGFAVERKRNLSGNGRLTSVVKQLTISQKPSLS